MDNQLQALVETWRERAASYLRSAGTLESFEPVRDITTSTTRAYELMAADRTECADELAALLSQREAPDTPLEAFIEHGALVIRIGIHRLAGAAAGSEWANQWNSHADDYIRDFAIVDAQQFAKDVQSAMLSEAEDGSSPLTRFLDQASKAAVEDGSIALNYEGVAIAFGKTHALETWAAPPESR